MSSQQSIKTAQYHLARHYLARLQQAERATYRGNENRAYWFHLIQQDWLQIKQWQAWSAARKDGDAEGARLCATFPMETLNILRAQLTPSEHLAWVQQAIEAAQKLNDSAVERALFYQLGLAYLNVELLDLAEESAHHLMESAQAAQDELNLGRAWYILGASNLLRGIYDSADDYFHKSIDILIAHNATDETARVWRGFGRIALYRGDYQQSYEYHIRYFSSVAASGNIRELGAAHIALCGVLLVLHNFQEAADSASRALEIAYNNGFSRMIPAALISLADAEKELAKFDDAHNHYEEGIATARAISPPSTIANGLYGLGQICALQGSTEKALALFEEALELARKSHLLFRICEVAHDMVILHLDRNEIDAARVRLSDLVTSAQQLGTPHFMAKALGAAVLLWQQKNEYEQAALWAGLLTNYAHFLSPISISTAVHEQLQAKLGSECYRQLLEQGKILSLSSAIEAVLGQLEQIHPC